MIMCVHPKKTPSTIVDGQTEILPTNKCVTLSSFSHITMETEDRHFNSYFFCVLTNYAASSSCDIRTEH